jgi:cell division protein FtsL
MSTARARRSFALAPATLAPDADSRARGRHLRVVEGQTRRRLLGPMGVIIAIVVFAGMLAVAAVQAFLVQGQIQLDDLDNRVATQQAEYEQVRLDVARLEAPERIVEAAQSHLGMVEPADVTYLTPDRVDAPAPDEDDGATTGEEAAATDDDAGSWSEVKPYLERNG